PVGGLAVEDQRHIGGDLDGGAGAKAGEHGGFGVAAQRLPPGPHGRDAVATGQPFQVVAVGGGGGGGATVERVQGDEVAAQQGQRPAVEQQVVGGQHQAVFGGPGGDEQQAQQRRVGGVEDRGAFGVDQPVQLLRPVRQVDGVPADRHLGRNHLDGGAFGGAGERGAQGGVPVEQRAGGTFESVGVDGAREGEHRLRGVDVEAAGGEFGVEQ